MNTPDWNNGWRLSIKLIDAEEVEEEVGGGKETKRTEEKRKKTEMIN